jgi:hypothetical protein
MAASLATTTLNKKVDLVCILKTIDALLVYKDT